MLPLVVLVALKLPTVLASFSVVPPAEMVVSVPLVLITPAFSDTVPVELSVILPPLPADTVPVTDMAPVFTMSTLPPPVWFTPVTVNGAAVLVRSMSPEVAFWAWNRLTVLAPFKVVPPDEIELRVPVVVISPVPDSDIVLLVEVRFTS
jgi:hypothetical protein